MLKWIIPYAKSYRKQFILGPIFKLLEAILELFLPLYLAQLIDTGLLKHDKTAIFTNTAMILIFSVIGLGAVFICQYYASIASQGFGTNLRKATLHHIQQLSLQQQAKFGGQGLLTRLTNDINQLQQAAAMLIRLVIRAPFLSIGAIVMAFRMNASLAWIFVIILPLFALLLAYIMIKTVPRFKQVQSSLETFSQSISDFLSGIRVIRAFNRQDVFQEKETQESQDIATSAIKAGNISALLTPGTTLMINLGILLLLFIGSQFIQIGSIQPGELVAMINYMSQMLLAMIVIANLVVTFTKAKASGDRVADLLATPIKKTKESAPITDIQQIECHHIDYRYTKESGNALTNIQFKLQQNEKLGIIGPTGSGKSTLIKLLAGLLQPTSGQITVNRHPLNHYRQKDWHQIIGVVPQKAALFKGTIRSNLQFGKPTATDAECWQVLEQVQLADYVRQLPQQLDTPVERGGHNFSGGQRQRLTIARALIKQPQLLILDDSLSALDNQTEKEIRQIIYQLNTMVVIISQRIHSIQEADQIIMLDNGEIVASGTHQTLLKTNALYQEMNASQKEGRE